MGNRRSEKILCLHSGSTYRDPALVTSLGEGFEGTVEITGLLSYKPDQPWPYAADVDRIRVLPRSLEDLSKLLNLRSLTIDGSHLTSLKGLPRSVTDISL